MVGKLSVEVGRGSRHGDTINILNRNKNSCDLINCPFENGKLDGKCHRNNGDAVLVFQNGVSRVILAGVREHALCVQED